MPSPAPDTNLSLWVRQSPPSRLSICSLSLHLLLPFAWDSDLQMFLKGEKPSKPGVAGHSENRTEGLRACPLWEGERSMRASPLPSPSPCEAQSSPGLDFERVKMYSVEGKNTALQILFLLWFLYYHKENDRNLCTETWCISADSNVSVLCSDCFREHGLRLSSSFLSFQSLWGFGGAGSMGSFGSSRVRFGVGVGCCPPLSMCGSLHNGSASRSVGLIHPFGHCRLPLSRLGQKGPLRHFWPCSFWRGHTMEL